MSDFEKTTKQVDKLPSIVKQITLAAGGKVSDDADILAFAQRTVPVGKIATVIVSIEVTKLEDV